MPQNYFRIAVLILLVMCCGSAVTVSAQEEYKDLIAKYKGELAIIANYEEDLVIKEEDGKLVATSDIEEERLLLSELAPGVYNSVSIYHSYFNQLRHYDAVALVPSGSGYKKIKDYLTKTNSSQSESIFYDDSKVTELTFTGLTINSVIKTKYSISQTDLHLLPVFYFREGLRVAKFTYKITAPRYVELKFAIRGEDKNSIVQTKEETRNTVTYTFTVTDAPVIKNYSDVPSYSYYIPMVIPYIASCQLPHDDHRVGFLGNTTDLYHYLYEYLRNVNTKMDDKLAQTVDEITKNDNNPTDKAKHIYQWVQKNIHYIAFEDSLGGFVPRQAADICQRKFGDCKDMASILTAMCRKAGIEAYFTWIGTKHLPYTYEETPLPLVSNHMICTIHIGNDWIFMDGTDPVIPFGANPSAIQNKEALIAIDEKNFKIMKVPVTPEDKNQLIDSTYIKIEGQAVRGEVVLNYTGYEAWELDYLMVYYKNDQREQYIKSLTTRGSNKYVQLGYKFDQANDESKKAHVVSQFTIDNYVQNAGNERFINLNLDNTSDYRPIDVKDRSTPYYGKYKYKMRQVVVLEIPAGYTASVPSDDHGKLGDIWNYDLSYKVNPGNVTLVKEFEMNSITIPVDQFTENNKMVERLKKQYKESITLTAK